jgi:hypothetical protein
MAEPFRPDFPANQYRVDPIYARMTLPRNTNDGRGSFLEFVIFLVNYQLQVNLKLLFFLEILFQLQNQILTLMLG